MNYNNEDEMNGKITVVRNNGFSTKGYEKINRNFLQGGEVSLEAIGLVCNILSYSDGWVLHKTELYKRFAKNKRRSIDRMWDELTENGYVLQFRKRSGSKYEYQYLVSSDRFTKERIMEVAKKVEKKGFMFYHKAIKHLKSFNLSEVLDELLATGKEVAKKSFGEKENINFNEILKEIDEEKAVQHSQVEPDVRQETKQEIQNETVQEHGDINVSPTVHFEQSNVSSSECTDKRYNIKRYNNKDFKEEDINKLNINTQSPELKLVAEQLLYFDMDSNEQLDVLSFLSAQPQLDLDAVTQQINWMIIKAQDSTGIGSFSSYFKNGYLRRVSNKNIKTIDTSDSTILPKVPMFNWLTGSENVLV